MRTTSNFRSNAAAVIALTIASLTVPTLAHAKRMGGSRSAPSSINRAPAAAPAAAPKAPIAPAASTAPTAPKVTPAATPPLRQRPQPQPLQPRPLQARAWARRWAQPWSAVLWALWPAVHWQAACHQTKKRKKPNKPKQPPLKKKRRTCSARPMQPNPRQKLPAPPPSDAQRGLAALIHPFLYF